MWCVDEEVEQIALLSLYSNYNHFIIIFITFHLRARSCGLKLNMFIKSDNWDTTIFKRHRTEIETTDNRDGSLISLHRPPAIKNEVQGTDYWTEQTCNEHELHVIVLLYRERVRVRPVEVLPCRLTFIFVRWPLLKEICLDIF